MSKRSERDGRLAGRFQASVAVAAGGGGAEAEGGGDRACWAHLVCPECGAMTTEGHRPGCMLAQGARAREG
jgi:hypothetical protein